MKINSPTKPGPGWKHIAGSVYEHSTGARIHLGGLIKLSNKKFLHLDYTSEGAMGRILIKMNGDNRKRGLMAWAAREEFINES